MPSLSLPCPRPFLLSYSDGAYHLSRVDGVAPDGLTETTVLRSYPATPEGLQMAQRSAARRIARISR